MNSPGITGSMILPQQPASTVEAPELGAIPSSSKASASPEIADTPLSIQSNYETLFNLAPIGYLIVYEDMTIREINRAAASLLGTPRLELLGNPLILYAQAQYRDSLRTHFRRVFSGHEESIELDFDHPAGPVRVQLHSARIQESATERPCYLCSLIDLSGRQNTQDELVRHQARLKALQIEQTKRTAELQDQLLEESTNRRKAQQEARLHSQAVQARSLELDRLRRDLADQTTKQQHTEQHLARLQQHLTRLTQGLTEPSAPLAEPKSSAFSTPNELPSPEQLHQIHHQLLGRIEKLDAGLRRRQVAAEPKIRLVLRLLAQSDRLRRMRVNPHGRIPVQSLEQSLRTTEILLQKTCRLNSIAAWQYDSACGQWVTCTGLALLMGDRKGGIEPDYAAFCTSIVPEDRQTFRQILQSLPSDPPIQVADIRLVQNNGTIRLVRHTLESILQPDKTVRLSAAVIDITAWKKSESHKTRCLQRLSRLGRDQIVGLSVQRDQLLLEQSSLNAQVEDLRRQRSVLENRIETLQAGLGDLRQKHGAERERNRQLVTQFRKHKDRLTQLVGERTRQIEDIRRSVNARHQSLQARISELTLQLGESQSLADQRQREIECLQQQSIRQQQTAQLQGIRERDSFESRIRELTDSLAAAHIDIENHRRITAESQIEHRQQIQSLQSSLAESESTADHLNDNLEQLRRQYDALATQASEEIERLKADLAMARRDLLGSQSECRRLTGESQTARNENLLEVQQLRHHLDSTLQTVARLQEQIQSQQSQSEQSTLALRSDLDNLGSRLAESQIDFEAFLRMVRDDIQRLLARFQTATDNEELPKLADQIAELADIAHLLIATGRIDEVSNVDTQSLVEGILDSFHDWIDQTGVRIDIGPLPPCLADGNLLARVFVELIDNALKFLAPDRPGRIAINAWAQEHQWFCQIEDNGIGMAPDRIDRAFELGFQLAPNTPGRGLGLAFVHRIVNLHRGRIEVDSQAGHGTRILLALPLD